jgi:hypothetical protein
MPQQIATLVVLTAAVKLVYTHPATLSSMTDDFTLIYQFYAICDARCILKIPPKHEPE